MVLAQPLHLSGPGPSQSDGPNEIAGVLIELPFGGQDRDRGAESLKLLPREGPFATALSVLLDDLSGQRATDVASWILC